MRSRIPVTVFFATLLLFGIISLFRLKITLLPKVESPVVTVVTAFPGATPEDVEKLVTHRIEEALNGVEGVKEIESQSAEGLSVVKAILHWGRNPEVAAIEAREKVDLIRPLLPQDVLRPMVFRFDPSSEPVLIAVCFSKRKFLRFWLKTKIKPYLERLKGVGAVKLFGGDTPEVKVLVPPSRLEGYGLTYTELAGVIKESNFNWPAGYLKHGDLEIPVKTVGEFQSLQDIEQVPVRTSGGAVFLKEIAQVSLAPKKRTAFCLYNGREVVGLSFIKEAGANTVEVCNRIRKAFARLAERYPDLKFEVIKDSSVFIKRALQNVAVAAVLGAVSVTLVLGLFLKSVAPALLVSLSIPLSVIPTVLIFYILGRSINLMTTGGIALGIGMLVDASIVSLEAVIRHRTAKGVFWALLFSALTTVIVFVPLLFAGGMAGQLFSDLAVAVSASLFFSLLVALLFIPAYATDIKTVSPPQWVNDLELLYLKSLKEIFKRKKTALTGAFLVSLLGLSILVLLPKSLFPRIPVKCVEGKIELSPGTPLQQTLSTGFAFCKSVAPLCKVVYVEGGYEPEDWIGRQTGQKDIHLMSFYIELKNPRLFGRVKSAELPGKMQFYPVLNPLEKVLIGSEKFNCYCESAHWKEVKKALKKAGIEFESSYREKEYMRVKLVEELASRFGVTSKQLGLELRGFLNGLRASYFRKDNEDIEIKVECPQFMRTIDNMLMVPVRTQSGKIIEAGLLSRFSWEKKPVVINRINQRGVIKLNIHGKPPASVLKLIIPGRREKEMKEMLKKLVFSFILAVVVIYMLLAGRFESYRISAYLLTAIPMVFSGAGLALLLTGKTLNIQSATGLVMLAGMAVNGTILLYESYLKTLDIFEACRQRFLPIVMSTLTTAAGLLPLAVGVGPEGRVQSDLAISVIGGLLTSTLLTLYAFPLLISHETS